MKQLGKHMAFNEGGKNLRQTHSIEAPINTIGQFVGLDRKAGCEAAYTSGVSPATRSRCLKWSWSCPFLEGPVAIPQGRLQIAYWHGPVSYLQAVSWHREGLCIRRRLPPYHAAALRRSARQTVGWAAAGDTLNTYIYIYIYDIVANMMNI